MLQKKKYNDLLAIMGIVRKLLKRRIHRKNNCYDTHPTREVMVILVFLVLSGMRYVPDLPMFYILEN